MVHEGENGILERRLYAEQEEEFEGVIKVTVQGQATPAKQNLGELKSSFTATHIFPVMFPVWVVDQEGMWWSG